MGEKINDRGSHYLSSSVIRGEEVDGGCFIDDAEEGVVGNINLVF